MMCYAMIIVARKMYVHVHTYCRYVRMCFFFYFSVCKILFIDVCMYLFVCSDSAAKNRSRFFADSFDGKKKKSRRLHVGEIEDMWCGGRSPTFTFFRRREQMAFHLSNVCPFPSSETLQFVCVVYLKVWWLFVRKNGPGRKTCPGNAGIFVVRKRSYASKCIKRAICVQICLRTNLSYSLWLWRHWIIPKTNLSTSFVRNFCR